MQAVTTIGLDIAKSVFQIHGVDAAGKARLFRDQTWVQKTARPVVEELMNKLCVSAQMITDETGMRIEHGFEPYSAGFRCVLRHGRVTLEVWWKQFYTNVIDDAKLDCTEYNSRVYLERERMLRIREPTSVGQKSYHPDLSMARELRWLDDKKPDQLLSNDEVVQRCMEQLLGLVDRMNRGELPPLRL
jgi:hypothetical protein